VDLLAELRTEPYVLIQKRQEEIVTNINLLDEAELVRHHRYLDSRKKMEFLSGRCLVKRELAEALGKTPSSVSLSLSENGKPFYKQEDNKPIYFNLSHGSGYYVLAISLSPVGVDVEEKRDLDFEIMRPIFSDSEVEQLETIPKEELSDQGLKLFTAKEAFIKATDKQYGLDEIEFGLVKGSWSLQFPKRNCIIEHIIDNDLVIAISVLQV